MILALCAAMLVVPHHRWRDDPFRPRTLVGIYVDLFPEIPALVAPRNAVFLLLAIAGVVICFYPAAMVLMIRFLTAGGLRRGADIFVVAGLVGLVGAAANFIAMIVLDMNISSDVTSSAKYQTVFVAVIPLVQIAFALASIAIGVSATCANWAHRMVVAV